MLRIGIDLGGTKIAGVVLADDGTERAARRVPTPQGNYADTVAAATALVRALEKDVGTAALPVGVGHPGATIPETGLIKNANSTCLNGRPLQRDLQAALGRPVAMANDANCLALSELRDGAASGASPVFAVILGTGVGGALAVDGRVVTGRHAIAGEWGHNPLPWPRPDWNEEPGSRCWCGHDGCIETWLSGVGLATDHVRLGGPSVPAETVARRAARGEAIAEETLRRHADRLARALAHVINLIDPQVIVLGGGLSRLSGLYRAVPARWSRWVFTAPVETRLVPAIHGDASGVRGAAWLTRPAGEAPSRGRPQGAPDDCHAPPGAA